MKKINFKKKEILKRLVKKNKYRDIIGYDKFYLINETNVIISNNKILNSKKKEKIKVFVKNAYYCFNSGNWR